MDMPDRPAPPHPQVADATAATASGGSTRDRDVRADALLAVRCQLGERAAFDDLIRRWAQPLRRYVARVGGDESTADELVQDIWLRVLQGIGRLQDPAKLRAWLFGIAHRRLMDRLRDRYASPIDADADADAALDVRPDAAPEPDGLLAGRDLERGLARLPPAERDVLSLFYLEELSLADVARVLAVPVGTVKSRLFRARHLLRQQFTGDDHG
jgi:RNA polymerase sigma-70 factor (ECF subfamily)